LTQVENAIVQAPGALLKAAMKTQRFVKRKLMRQVRRVMPLLMSPKAKKKKVAPPKRPHEILKREPQGGSSGRRSAWDDEETKLSDEVMGDEEIFRVV
jgi:hypothetical protein